MRFALAFSLSVCLTGAVFSAAPQDADPPAAKKPPAEKPDRSGEAPLRAFLNGLASRGGVHFVVRSLERRGNGDFELNGHTEIWSRAPGVFRLQQASYFDGATLWIGSGSRWVSDPMSVGARVRRFASPASWAKAPPVLRNTPGFVSLLLLQGPEAFGSLVDEDAPVTFETDGPRTTFASKGFFGDWKLLTRRGAPVRLEVRQGTGRRQNVVREEFVLWEVGARLPDSLFAVPPSSDSEVEPAEG